MTEFGQATIELSNPYLKLEVNEPHLHFRKVLNSVQDAVAWANEEAAFWDQVRSRVVTIMEQNGIGNVQWSGAVFEPLAAFQKAVIADQKLKSAELATKDKTASATTIAASDALLSGIAQSDVLVRGSTVGDRVLALESSQPLAFAIAITTHVPNVSFLKVSNRHGQDRPWAVKQVIDGYRARHPARLSEVEGQGGALAKRVEELEAMLNGARETYEAITQLAETLRQKVATEKAVEVWKERIDSHGLRIVSAMKWIVLNFLIAAAIVVALLASLRPSGWLNSLLGGNLDAWTRTVLLGIPIVAAIWIIRILTVKYRISLAGAEDASERVAMVETLYALSAENKTAPTEAERMLVMNALFRPGPSRDHDNSLPNTIVEQAAQVLVRSKS